MAATLEKPFGEYLCSYSLQIAATNRYVAVFTLISLSAANHHYGVSSFDKLCYVMLCYVRVKVLVAVFSQ